MPKSAEIYPMWANIPQYVECCEYGWTCLKYNVPK